MNVLTAPIAMRLPGFSLMACALLASCSSSAPTSADAGFAEAGSAAGSSGAGASGDGSAAGATVDALISSDGEIDAAAVNDAPPEREGADDAFEAGPPAAIDLSLWQLQLPTGSGTSPTTVSPAQLVAGLSSTYFYRAPGGGQIFMDPATGITTPGSQHCRTELREMMRDGKAAAWPSAGTNELMVSGKVLQVGGGASGHVTIGQVFNGTDAIPLVELEYSTKLRGFQVLYEEGKGAGTTTDLKIPVALGAAYSFTLALSGSVLTVAVDGKVGYTHTPSAAALGKSFYFKAGNYNQTSAAGPISTTPYTVVEIDALAVVHR